MNTDTITPTRRKKSRLGTAALLFAARCIHRVPPRAALGFGRLLGRIVPHLSARHYRRVCRDIGLAFADEQEFPALVRIARGFYRRLGESLMEFLRLPYMTDEEIRAWAPLEGTAHLDAALAAGRGAILLTAHLGNWEVCAPVMGLSPYPTTAIARPQRDSALTTLFNRIREAHGLRVVPMTDIRGCLRTLQRNECLGIVGDVNANVPGAFVQFFGRPAATYTGAAYLARRTGAPVLTIFDERLPDGTHHVVIGPPIPLVETDDTARDLLINTMRMQHVIQGEIRRRPQDWFWLLDRWRTTPDEVPQPDRIPMEHRDLTPAEAARALEFTR